MTRMTSDSDISASMPTDKVDNGGADITAELSVVTLTTDEYEQILVRIKYLEEHVLQQPTAIKQRNIKLSKHQYDGIRDNDKITN